MHAELPVDQPPVVAFTAFADAWPRAREMEKGAALCAIGAGRTLTLTLSAEKISYLKAYQGKEKYITAHTIENFYTNSILCVNYSNCMPTKEKEKAIKTHMNEHLYCNGILLCMNHSNCMPIARKFMQATKTFSCIYLKRKLSLLGFSTNF